MSIIVIAAYLRDLEVTGSISPYMPVLAASLYNRLHVLHHPLSLPPLELTNVGFHPV